MRAKVVVLALFLVACAGDPPPRATPPAAPAANDPAYTIAGVRGWYLVGNALTPGGDSLHATVTAPSDVGYVDAWVAGGAGVRLTRQGDQFTLDAPIGDLAAGSYPVVFAADGADTAFAAFTFVRSAPLYVLASTDWDFSDPGANALAVQETFHRKHPAMRVTNFVGPYLFTDPVVTDARRAQILDWIHTEHDTHHGEIGLHIHPYCNFVESAGLTCDTTDSTVQASDPSGYTVGLYAYSHDDMLTMLRAADQLFQANGLGKPVTFRAGGWTATVDTLRALQDDGFIADTSALNWARIEEWAGTGTLYAWNMEHWSSIGDTSQPYYPNDGDLLSTSDPTLSLLEVPDNAAMVDYVSVDEMTGILQANWDGTALAAPRTVMWGWHPSMQLTPDEISRVDDFFGVVDQWLAADGNGPVVYEILSDMPVVWPRSQTP